jgi:hypothetical protein
VVNAGHKPLWVRISAIGLHRADRAPLAMTHALVVFREDARSRTTLEVILKAA